MFTTIFKTPFSYWLISIGFVVLPTLFFEHFPAEAWYARYAVPIAKLADGTWKTIFWVDFAVFALIAGVIALVLSYKKSRKPVS